MPQLGHQLGLALEALRGLWVGAVVGTEDLDGDLATEALVESSVDDTHRAIPKTARYPILTGQERPWTDGLPLPPGSSV